jgi:hypothetical protein
MGDAIAQQVAEFFADPYGFVLWAFPWGEGELAGQEPDDWQISVLETIGKALRDDPGRAVQFATASGHGIGKSALTSWLILWAMSTRAHLNCVVTANTGTQLSTKTWRELALWHKRAINREWFDWTATTFRHRHFPATWTASAIPNTEHNSEAFAGTHAKHVLLLFDEASAVPDKIWEVSEGAMTTPGAIWCVFGNPTRNTGRFRECFGRYKHRWHTLCVDSRTARMTDKTKLRQWVDDYGEDSDFVRVRVKGEFPRAGDTQFIPADIVQAANARTIDSRVFAEYPRFLGVDVARFGMDQSVIIRRQGSKVWEPRSWRGIDTMELSGYVIEEIRNFNPTVVFIDGGGVGAGVVDRLRHEHLPRVKIVDVQFGAQANDKRLYANVRAELWARMRDWLKGEVDLPQHRGLSDGLVQPEYGFNARMQLQLERKEDMKARGLGSPDEADALAVTFALAAMDPEQRQARAAARRVTHGNRLYV